MNDNTKKPLTRDQLIEEIIRAHEEGRHPDVSTCCVQRVNAHGWLQSYRDLDLYDVHARGTIWPMLDLSGTEYKEADLFRARFTDSVVRGVSFERAQLIEAIIERSDCSHTNLRLVRMDSSEFCQCLLQGANGAAGSFRGTIFDHVDASDASFHQATLEDAFCPEMVLVRANLRSARCARINLSSADLRGADASYADWTHAYLIDAQLAGVTLAWTKLDGILLGHDTDAALAQMRQANLFIAKRGVWAVCARAASPDLVATYRDQLAQGHSDPGLFAALGVEPPEDCTMSMRDPETKRLLAASRFLGALSPCILTSGTIHPWWNPHPVQRILHDWLTEWIEQGKSVSLHQTSIVE